jgi:hypothetical protein
VRESYVVKAGKSMKAVELKAVELAAAEKIVGGKSPSH